MIAEAGLAALYLAAALALMQLAVSLVPALAPQAAQVARPLALAQGLLTAAAFACLIVLFVRTDLSVALVAANSHSAKPLLYRFAGTWGNHEGSMLLWVTVLALSGALLAVASRGIPERMLGATLGAQAALALGFYAFLLLASNPFARLDPAPVEGQGLNPLLQDPGLAFHPPTLYLGYVGLSVAFSLAVGALITRDVGPVLARAMRPWVLGSWVFLTVGIAAGSYWAYYELGWGGWWFWDPVENASLMPWLAATALLHSVSVLAARGGLRTWTMMLAVVAFSMSMVGTFLVRSGILTSVHAFAVDPTRGGFILALLLIYVGGALALFAWRAPAVGEGARFALVSREGALVLNNLLLSVILAVVFLGTLYPLMVEAATGEKLSVGPPYFDAVVGPLALLLMLLLVVGPLLRWRRHEAPLTKWVAPSLLAGVATLAATIILAPDISLLSRLGLVLGVALVPASLMPLAGRSLRRTPLATWGMAIAHLGVAVSVIGMASDSAFSRERLAAARPGEQLAVGPWLVAFNSVTPVAGPNWTAIEAELAVTQGGSERVLKPQARTFTSPVTETSEVAIATAWNGQLYTVLGRQSGQRWQLRLWWKPFVTLIWLGAGLIALGGLVSLIGRGWTNRRTRRRLAEAEL
ncbi:heme lyase CcmF/NrfE family subunit [Sphingomonas mesophila]|uniref:heme lyase CcmF/NrfE family subunit n=1 Tax=Sphingomonas mesophila TaxID=2303576 RepID=UPI000E589F99|nr:heme lyase CcmF/NrfE family subunit [Sphingomonas mesophila]